MMPTRTAAIALIVLLTAAEVITVAQSGTAEGVDAFLRGDYQRAVELLKPIAEAFAPSGEGAEFFMAVMYQNGLGVPVDPVRACAFFIKASISGPFQQQAMRLVPDSIAIGEERFKQCTLLLTAGFDNRFEPVTFTLGPGHWVSFELDGATIVYDGKIHPTQVSFESPQSVFLPLQHTVLNVGPTLARRDFIEVVRWIQERPDEWRLMWQLYEVVRDELVDVAAADVATTTGTPPKEPGFNIRNLVHLRVNADGDAEWAVLSGPDKGHEGVIETDAERRAAKEQERKRQEQAKAREEADRRIDWTRRLDAHRPPNFAYPQMEGCGAIFLAASSEDRTEAISVNADRMLLDLSTAPRTFDLATMPNGLDVKLHIYDRPVRQKMFCTDVRELPGPEEETWRAVAGFATIELGAPVNRRQAWPYPATVRITGAEFVNAGGGRVRQTQPLTLSALVGLMF